jgi:hypothetical protein
MALPRHVKRKKLRAIYFVFLLLIYGVDGMEGGSAGAGGAGRQSFMGIGGQVRDHQRPHSLLPFGHMCLICPKEGGKTSFILNFFINEILLALFLLYYEKIFFITTHCTEDTTSGYELLMARNHHGRFVFLDSMDEDTWDRKISDSAHPTKHNLVILDDMADNKPLMDFLAGKITKLTHPPPQGDHLHCWFVAHKFTASLPKEIRDNSDFFAFGRKSIVNFGPEFIGSVSSRDAVVKWGTHTLQPMTKVVNKSVKLLHDYLVVNTLVLDEYGERTFYLNFTHRIDPRPQSGAGRTFQARRAIPLPANQRVEVPIDTNNAALQLRAYCADPRYKIAAPDPTVPFDPMNEMTNGACFRVFCRLYPDRPEAQVESRVCVCVCAKRACEKQGMCEKGVRKTRGVRKGRVKNKGCAKREREKGARKGRVKIINLYTYTQATIATAPTARVFSSAVRFFRTPFSHTPCFSHALFAHPLFFAHPFHTPLVFRTPFSHTPCFSHALFAHPLFFARPFRTPLVFHTPFSHTPCFSHALFSPPPCFSRTLFAHRLSTPTTPTIHLNHIQLLNRTLLLTRQFHTMQTLLTPST